MALKDLLRKHGFESKKGVEVDLNDLVEDIDEPDDTDNINTNDDIFIWLHQDVAFFTTSFKVLK